MVVSQNSDAETSESPTAISQRGADPVGEPAGERRDRDDHQGRRQEADAGLERRVAEDVLHVESEEEELAPASRR